MRGARSSDITLWVFLAYFLLSIALIAWLFWPFGSPLIMACVVTGLFNPLFKRINRRSVPWLSSLATCAVIFLVVFVPIVLFVGILAQEAFDLHTMGRTAEISDQLQRLVEGSHVLERVNALLAPFGFEVSVGQLQDAFSELGKNVGLFLFEQTQKITSNILIFSVNYFFMLLVCYYLFLDGQRLLAFIFDVSPLPKVLEERLISKFQDMAGAVLIGNGVSAIIQGVLGGGALRWRDCSRPCCGASSWGCWPFCPLSASGSFFCPPRLSCF